MPSKFPLIATDYIQSNFKEHTISANGIILAKYFSVTNHLASRVDRLLLQLVS
jgi:hypothetical protein